MEIISICLYLCFKKDNKVFIVWIVGWVVFIFVCFFNFFCIMFGLIVNLLRKFFFLVKIFIGNICIWCFSKNVFGKLVIELVIIVIFVWGFFVILYCRCILFIFWYVIMLYVVMRFKIFFGLFVWIWIFICFLLFVIIKEFFLVVRIFCKCWCEIVVCLIINFE